MTACKNDCIILSDKVRFKRNVTSPLEFLYIKFTPNMRCSFRLSIPIDIIKSTTHPWILESFQRIEETENQTDTLSVHYLEHLLNDILFRLCFEKSDNKAINNNETLDDELVTNAVNYIKDNIN